MHTCPFGSPDTRVGRPRPQLRQPRSKAGLAPEWMFLALGLRADKPLADSLTRPGVAPVSLTAGLGEDLASTSQLTLRRACILSGMTR